MRAGPRRSGARPDALHKQLREAGYHGGYTRLTDFIREWRTQQGSVAISAISADRQ
jgi:hypothetical protein